MTSGVQTGAGSRSLSFLEQYFSVLERHLREIRDTQAEALVRTVEAMVESVRRGGVIHLFGAGHSQLMVEEVWYRAGQLACISPLFDQGLWPHNSPRKGSRLERLEGYGRTLMAGHDLRAGEVLVVVSNSGRNAVPVEVALEGRERGLVVVALTSLAYSSSVTSRHSSGKRLFELADIVIDNLGPPGEAAVPLPSGIPAGATTTVTNAAILNGVLVEVAATFEAAGAQAPVFRSGNLDDSRERNLRLQEQYADRVPLFRF